MGDFDWGQGAQGAAGGAMTGAAMGSVIGPWGTVIGGAVGGIAGGLLGGFSGDPKKEYADLLKKLSDGYQSRVAPTVGTAHAQQSGLVQNRAGLITQLEAMARGEGPSAARQQMRDGMDRAVGAQASAAAGAGGRGVNAGAALRNATNNSASIMSQGNRDMGVMRAQEQANAIGQLGQNISQGINADNSLNTWNAGATNQGNQFNAQLAMQQLGLNDQMQLNSLLAAAGMQPMPMGTSLMAGGAQMMPTMLQNTAAHMNQPQGYQGAVGPQKAGDPGWEQSPWGQQQAKQQAAQQQKAYMDNLNRGVPAPMSGQQTNNLFGSHTWNS